jgi:hypothetical protein
MTTSSAAENIGSAKATATEQQFVINLCSSTSPMALAHPSSPELKRYTFFVSRQREDGRERFRLHMGYFGTQEHAAEVLAVVRDVYPAAWAGPAPTHGVARRGKIAPVQLAPAVAQATVAKPVAEPPAAPFTTTVPVQPAAADVTVVAAPTLAISATDATLVATAPGERALEQTMSDMRSVMAHLDSDTTQIQELPATPPAKPFAQVEVPVAAPRPLDPPRLQPVAPKVAANKPTAKELTPVQELAVLEAPPPVMRPMNLAVPVAKPLPTVQDDGALKLVPEAEEAEPEAAEAEPTVRVLTPEDTQSLTDIKLDKANNAPPCFAVQLVWSVSPIDVASLPTLAIFDAYTLYNVEGNRQGRKWYGLRLGFFTDPNSATQVANYVRADYGSVAVVPVAVKEKDRATGLTAPSPLDSGISPPLRAAEHLSTNRETMEGFELVADDRPVPQKRDLDMPEQSQQAANPKQKDPAVVAAAVRAKLDKVLNMNGAPPVEPGRGNAVRATTKVNGKRVAVRKKPDANASTAPGATLVLESTLDILGASTLTIDEGTGKVVGDAIARRASAKKPAHGKFSKLLSRLSGG